MSLTLRHSAIKHFPLDCQCLIQSSCTWKPTDCHQTLPSLCVMLKVIHTGVGWVWVTRLHFNASHCHWLVCCVLVIRSYRLAKWFRETVSARVSTNNFKLVAGNPICLCMYMCTLTWHCVLFHLTLCSLHPFPRIFPLPYLAHHLWKTFVTTVLPSLMSPLIDLCVLMVSWRCEYFSLASFPNHFQFLITANLTAFWLAYCEQSKVHRSVLSSISYRARPNDCV